MEPKPDSAVNWHDVLAAGAMLGWTPRQIYRATLPELLFSITGYRQARGLGSPEQGMTRRRLKELHERYST
ncbi:phage tail assembly chaperone [Kordiimonas aquimaris]|uniref:phage tail assembly chaperone n=1 Tax=Kordiimonas aquimaris TaxID=707591 RepID=UPI00374D2DA9